jgi:hypothetical protein
MRRVVTAQGDLRPQRNVTRRVNILLLEDMLARHRHRLRFPLSSSGLRISYGFGVPRLRISYGYASESPQTQAKRPTLISRVFGVFARVCCTSQNTNQSGRTVRNGFPEPFPDPLRPNCGPAYRVHAGGCARQGRAYAIPHTRMLIDTLGLSSYHSSRAHRGAMCEDLV